MSNIVDIDIDILYCNTCFKHYLLLLFLLPNLIVNCIVAANANDKNLHS